MNKKIYAVMTSTAVATVLTAAVSTTAFAKVDGFLKENNGKLAFYNYEELMESATQKSVLGEDAPLFEEYENGKLVAFHDDAKGYVLSKSVMDAAQDSIVEEKEWKLNDITAAAKDTDIYKTSEKVVVRTVKDGKVVDKETGKPVEEALKIESVTCASKTKVKVVFETAVDSISKDNFEIKGGTVSSASLESDKKTVSLEVSGLKYGETYNIVAKDVLVNAVAKTSNVGTFGTPAVNQMWKLEVISNAKNNEVVANGADNTVITAKLINVATGEVDKNADNVVVAFNTTYGNLANARVTVQDGIATVVLNSEFSQKDVNAKINAQIIEASGDYKELIGKIEGNLNVNFVTSSGTITPNARPALVSAESNQADRITLNFNNPVTVRDFVEFDEKKNEFVVDVKGNAVLVDTLEAGTSIVEIEQNGVKKAIRGFKPVEGNSKAIEVILQKSDILKDNEKVSVKVNMPSNVGVQRTSKKFILTDARKPEATSVKADDLKHITVKFSEAICKAEIKLDGGLTLFEKTEMGEFDQVKLEDTRDIMVITTTDYLKSGDHSIQLASIYDFAGLSDSKNISTSQSLDFKVAADESIPTATVKVESPEQFRVKFNKIVTGFDESKLVLQRYDENDKKALKEEDKWKAANKKNFADYTVEPKVTVTHIKDTAEYVVELTEDWTKIYKTSETNKNYYNNQYRFVIGEKEVTNPANGKQNAKIVLPLNDKIMTEADTKSPIIAGFEPTLVQDVYKVIMSEPVKLTKADVNDTPSEQQVAGIPDTIIEFLGTDKDGKAITISGIVDGYADENGADKEFYVEPAAGQESLKELVNKGADKNWKLVVRSISDDVGNTAASLTHDFTITPDKQLEEEFMVDGIRINKQLYHGVKGFLNGDKEDTIVLKFTSGVKYVGDIENAVNPSNYLLDGETLPKGAIITVSDSDNNKDNGYDTVTITVPDGTLETTKGNKNVITISKSLKSYEEIELSGNYEVVFNVEDKMSDDKTQEEQEKKEIAKTKEELKTVISNVKEEEYTVESYKEFNKVVEEANKVLKNEDATKEQLKDAVKAVENARAKLERKDGKEEVVAPNAIVIKAKKSQDPSKILVKVKLEDGADASKWTVKVNGCALKYYEKSNLFGGTASGLKLEDDSEEYLKKLAQASVIVEAK